ncbi:MULTISPECIES: helix-turn-helix transcriptional regulator [unclassified Aureispira]|uniref:AraC family transcriptional regulator n=1 Tax=unclassified Aureispira TaxID=2649989 RepID=UPI0006984A3E|nr:MULTISPECIES: helix-turn-helix transcriptional regulator [unclassified Aureispira]WMX12251.1 helix-turn-helix transcriptional regulator [Aureispira sp. CCB-E]
MEFKHYQIVQIKTSNEDRDLEPHRHLYYELFFFFAGSGTHLIDFKDFDIKPPSIQLVGPHQLHQVKHSRDSQGYVIKIQPTLIASNPFLNNFFNFIQYNQHFEAGVAINKQEARLLKDSYLFLKSYNNNNSNDSIFAALSALNLYISILKKYQKLSKQAETSPNNEYFNQFLDLVEQNYHIEKSTDFYTQAMNLSLNRLNGIVKERTGMTAKKFLITRVLLEAKRLIIHSEKTVKEIAYQLDFLEPAHFSNFFKKHLGMTPSTFRIKFR